MKNIILTIGTLLALGISIINPAMAEQGVKIFELAESGQTIEFPMTAEEIAAKNAERKRLSKIRDGKRKQPIKRLHIIEMGESGQTVEFPMTAEEIAAEDAENERLSDVREAKLEMPQECVEKFELAESGIIIEFPSLGC